MSQLYAKEIVKGLATFIPGVKELACRGSGGTLSARYCYAVWLRHLVKASEAGLSTSPETVAELGPGDSLGIGLAAMLTGVDHYYGFDAKPHAADASNLAVLEELIGLFRERTRIPDETEFPHLSPSLTDYSFPKTLLTDPRMEACLDPERLEALRRALNGKRMEGDVIQLFYIAPWDDAGQVQPNSMDMVFSQAVLEHVADIDKTYRFLHQWLKPGGYMSHSIDFKSHGLTRDWYGHWTVSNLVWNLVIGKRPYLINRHPHSIHKRLIEQNGFRVLTDLRRESSGLERRNLSADLEGFSDEDLKTSGTFIQAVK